MTSGEIISELKKKASPKNVAGMARFGINTRGTLGVPLPEIRKLGREIGKNHELAQALWETEIHEARILASIIEDVAALKEEQIEHWVQGFDSWDICDQTCMNLFWQYKNAYVKVIKWAGAREDFVKRAGFALMASLAVKDKKADDKKFIKFFPLIKKYATDERNFVKKAVNWALRQIGKRNKNLNKLAIEAVNGILKDKKGNRASRWVALGALRELKSAAVKKRLK